MATVADLVAQTNWLTVVANSDEKGRRSAMRDRPVPLPRPGDAPGPKRKRRLGPPVSRDQLEALGFQVKEVDEDG